MPSAHGGTARTAPRTIRTRLLRILVLALAVLLALLGAAASEQISAYRNAAATADDARLEITLQGLVHELQRERGLTTGYVGGVRQLGAGLPAQRKATDAARARLARALRGRRDVAADSVRACLGRLDGLAGIRRHADDGTGAVEATFDYFTATITALDQLGLGLDDVHDTRLRDAYQALQVLGNVKEFTGEERAIVLGSVRAGRFSPGDHSRFLQIRAGRLAALENFPHTATGAQQRRLEAAFSTPDAERALAYESAAVHGGGRLSSRGIPPMSWWRSMTSTINGLHDVQISLGRDVERRAAGLENAAQRQLLLFVLFAFGTVAALGHLALDCVRSVSTPLAALAQQAREVAGTRLPRAVAAVRNGVQYPGRPPSITLPDRAGAEVLALATAFDRVQRAAFDLATEQAVLRRNTAESLVGLGRRNQDLVRRQIDFINKMEHAEAGPATLAGLFELDRLATRMRRNAESLLVLAGEARPRPCSAPLALTEVLRAALCEVEEYRRVGLRRIEPTHITGSAVAELAHLLAELIENALSFSPPDREVEIEGRHTGAGYLVAIADHGLGMGPQALAEANVRLSGNASFMAGPTRFLGHFVVGALARSRGIEVRLGNAPSAGVVAQVLIPGSLLTQAPGQPKATAAAADPAPARPLVPSPRAAAEDAGPLVSVAAETTVTEGRNENGPDRRDEPAGGWGA